MTEKLSFDMLESWLKQAGASLLTEGYACFLLYDPRLQDPLGVLDGRNRGRARWSIQVPAHVPDHIEKQPCLIRLDAQYAIGATDASALDDRLFLESLGVCLTELGEVMGGRAICGWLFSKEDIQLTADRLSSACAAVDVSGIRRWLRWQDPRVLGQMWHVLDDVQQTALLGPNSLFSIDLLGNRRRYGQEKASSAQVQRLALSQDQFRRLENCQFVVGYAQGWNAFQAQLPKDAQDLLHAAVLRAQTLGLTERDMTTYVMYAVQLRIGFDSHPPIAQALKRALDGEMSLEDAFSEVSETVWNAFAPTES